MNMIAVFEQSSQIAVITVNLSGKPRNGAFLLFQFFNYQFANVYIIVHIAYLFHIKKVDSCFSIEVFDYLTNKQEKPAHARERLTFLFLFCLWNCRSSNKKEQKITLYNYIFMFTNFKLANVRKITNCLLKTKKKFPISKIPIIFAPKIN